MKLETLNKILAVTAAAIGIAILVSTVTFFAVTKDGRYGTYRRMDPTPQKISAEKDGNGDRLEAFTDFRQIRVQAKSEKEGDECVIAVTPWLSYPSGDQILFEELSQKERQLKGIFASYFSSHTSRELHEKGENSIKKELMDAINAQLVMGKIRGVYFNDYFFIE